MNEHQVGLAYKEWNKFYKFIIKECYFTKEMNSVHDIMIRNTNDPLGQPTVKIDLLSFILKNMSGRTDNTSKYSDHYGVGFLDQN